MRRRRDAIRSDATAQVLVLVLGQDGSFKKVIGSRIGYLSGGFGEQGRGKEVLFLRVFDSEGECDACKASVPRAQVFGPAYLECKF